MLGDDVVFVKPGDPQALATAIEALTSDPDYLAQKQRDARTAAERFTSDEITRDLAQWIIDSKQSRKQHQGVMNKLKKILNSPHSPMVLPRNRARGTVVGNSKELGFVDRGVHGTPLTDRRIQLRAGRGLRILHQRTDFRRRPRRRAGQPNRHDLRRSAIRCARCPIENAGR